MYIDEAHIRTMDIDFEGPSPKSAKKKEITVDHFTCTDGIDLKKLSSFIENYKDNVAGDNAEVELLVTFRRKHY